MNEKIKVLSGKNDVVNVSQYRQKIRFAIVKEIKLLSGQSSNLDNKIIGSYCKHCKGFFNPEGRVPEDKLCWVERSIKDDLLKESDLSIIPDWINENSLDVSIKRTFDIDQSIDLKMYSEEYELIAVFDTGVLYLNNGVLEKRIRNNVEEIYFST
jgi:hypothetical protein